MNMTQSTILAEEAAGCLSDNSVASYLYPKPPNQLKIFAKHRLVSAENTAAVRYLDYMLTKTTLTTQKVTHSNIKDIGRRIHDFHLMQHHQQKEEAVREAVKKTVERLETKQEAVIKEMEEKADRDKGIALLQQKNYYEELARRTRAGRDTLEEERVERIIRKMEKEKKQALKDQWEEAERLKQEAINRVLTEQHKRLRASAAMEREKAIASALRGARDRFSSKLQKVVEETKEECRKISKEVEEKKEELHKIEIQRLNERIVDLTKESKLRLKKQMSAQREFVAMESDYSRFLDVVPHYHPSHFLIVPRKYGHGVERGRKDMTSQTDLISFDQRSVGVETNVKLLARS